MLITLSFGVLFIPIIIQYYVIKINKIRNNKIYFFLLSISNLILHLIATVLSLILAINAITNDGNKCASGAAGMLFFAFIFGAVLLILILLQFISLNKTK